MKLSEYKIPGHPTIFYRENTSDSVIMNANLGPNPEYLFPNDLEPKVILDIGANIGIVSIAMSNRYPKAKIFAFEPDPENYKILMMNTKDYPNVITHPYALGKENGHRELYPSEEEWNHGGSSLHKRGVRTDRFESVWTMSVRQFIEENRLRVDMIKIDTEGSEHEILTGMSIDQLARVKWIIGELHGEMDYELLRYLDEDFDLAFQKRMGSRVFAFYARNRGLK